jgi:hypothetical protein
MERLTKEELDFLTPEHREVAKRLGEFEQGQLRALIASQKADLAKLDAKIAKQTRLLHGAAIRNRVEEALTKGGAGSNVELLRPHVATRVRVVEQDDGAFDFHVVDRDGKPRLRDGRRMTLDELVSEVKRLPELEGFFTKNGRHA